MHGFEGVYVCVFPLPFKEQSKRSCLGVFIHQRRVILKEFKYSISQQCSLVKENASKVLEFTQQ